MWLVLKALWFTFFIHWGACLALFFGGWYFLKKGHKEWGWKVPFVFATVFSFYHGFTTVFSAHQNQVLGVYQQELQNEAQAEAEKFRAGQAGTNIKMKQEFLSVVENLVRNPAQITPEIKQKLFTTYAGLFINGNSDKHLYRENIVNIYKCQKAFMEDALTTLQTKKVAKSKTREDCYDLEGSFFGRAKLLGAEAEKTEDGNLDGIAKSGRLPASDGSSQDVTPEALKKSILLQQTSVDAVKNLFN